MKPIFTRIGARFASGYSFDQGGFMFAVTEYTVNDVVAFQESLLNLRL